jgi:hypothetical protein
MAETFKAMLIVTGYKKNIGSKKNDKENLANTKPMARVDALVALMSIWKV